MKMVVADDEREEREGIRYLIQKYGYPFTVYEAKNGKEALALYEKVQPEVVLTDIKMPVMDGVELASKIRLQNADTKIIIFSAYSDFEYVRQAVIVNAVDYLLKPIELPEFARLMDKVTAEVQQEAKRREKESQDARAQRDNVLYKIFTGAPIGDEQEREIWASLRGPVGGPIRIVFVEFYDNCLEQSGETLLQLVKTYLGSGTELATLYPNEGFLILSDRRILRQPELEQQMEKLMRDVQRYAGSSGRAMVSAEIGSFGELKEQIRHITDLQNQVFDPEKALYWVEDSYRYTESYASEIEYRQKRVLDAIRAKNAGQIEEENALLLQQIQKSRFLSRLYMQNLFYTILKAVYEKTPAPENEEVLVMAEELFRLKDARSILARYQEGIAGCIRKMQQGSAQENDTVAAICEWIEREYTRNISLNDIAAMVHMSPAYVSHLFKVSRGRSIVQYITDLRMARAVYLLKNESYKVGQIAQLCGYTNPSYFNTTFKTYYGMTPKQYKEQENG